MQAGLLTRLKIHQILKKLKTSNLSFDEVFEKKIDNQNFSIRDKKLIYSIVLNSMRNYIYVENIINKFAKKIEVNSDSYFLLLSAITQLLILNFKEFAVVHSTVELAKKKQLKTSKQFINGILRNIIRHKNKLLQNTNQFSKLPPWFTKKVVWTKKEKDFFLETIAKEPDLHLVFKSKNDINKIKYSFIKTTKISMSLKRRNLIENLEGYNEGMWWVQDFSAMLPIYLLNDIKHKNVADFCAAPGGKTFQLIAKKATVTSIEKNKKRYQIMKKNLNRLNFKCNLLLDDVFNLGTQKKFDIIILDAPCSSIGTIRRNPEIFFRYKAPDFQKIISKQKNLLNKAKNLLTKQGMIIYMVCSFLDEEGKNIINEFLIKNKNFKLEKFSTKNLISAKSFINNQGMYHVMPCNMQNNALIDGFFAAKLRKDD